MKAWLDEWAAVVTALTIIATAAGWLWSKVVAKAVRDAIGDVVEDKVAPLRSELRAELEPIRLQLVTNGGSSLVDGFRRLERAVGALDASQRVYEQTCNAQHAQIWVELARAGIDRRHEARRDGDDA